MNEPFIDNQPEHHFNPVPSLFTLCNALCGFTSILYTLGAEDGHVPAISLWLVFGAMLFDVLDGLAARVLKAQSLHGMNLDSLADAISFGAAPAAIIHQLIMGRIALAGHFPGLAWFVAAFYLGCALWRLAQYNSIAMQETEDHSDFVGLPSPGAAALVCAMAILVPELDLGAKLMLIAYIAYSVISAGLMVSAVPYTHIRRWLTNTRKWVPVLFIGAVVASIFLFKVWAMVAWAHFYAFSAPFIALEARVMQRRHANI